MLGIESQDMNFSGLKPGIPAALLRRGSLMTAEARVVSQSSLLDAVRALEPQIRAAEDFLERECCLPEPLFEALRKTGMFRVSWWKASGGLELDPLTQMDVFEELSRLNGSVGWIGTFGGLNGLIAATLDPAAISDRLEASESLIRRNVYARVQRTASISSWEAVEARRVTTAALSERQRGSIGSGPFLMRGQLVGKSHPGMLVLGPIDSLRGRKRRVRKTSNRDPA
jgi:alkylation response protein AidB-like acyl-CoA dehydrogenase